jgi:acyl-CoA thioesterase
MNLEEVRSLFAADRFATEVCGITIEDIWPGGALCRMSRTPAHANVLGEIQGGAIFTLADFTFAIAANHESQNPIAVSLSVAISYLRSSKGSVLTARAREISATRQTVVYEVLVSDDLGKDIALMQINGFRKEIGPKNAASAGVDKGRAC